MSCDCDSLKELIWDLENKVEMYQAVAFWFKDLFNKILGGGSVTTLVGGATGFYFFKRNKWRSHGKKKAKI